MSEWNAVLYDQKHEFVSKFGGSLVEILAPQKGEMILDLVCGTGDLGLKNFSPKKDDFSTFSRSAISF